MSRLSTGNRNANDTPDRLAAFRAASQWGVLDLAELLACGYSKQAIGRRCERGLLHRIYPGVYAVGSPKLSVQAKFLAATKATNGVLSHYSAASLWRLVDFDEDAPPQVTVTTSGTRKILGVEVHRTRRPFRVVRLDGMPVTTAARALADASRTLPPISLRRAAREALTLRRATVKELLGHTRQLDEALALGFVPTQTVLEDTVDDLIRTTFEAPVAQQTLVLDGIPTTPDFRWPHLKLCVEADGRQFHEHELARQDDAAKQARLEAHGERVLRITWTQATTQPQQTLDRLENAGAPLRG